MTLIDTEPNPSQPSGRHRWAIIVAAAVAAAAVVAIAVGGLVIATRDDDATGDVPVNQPTTVAPPATVATPLQIPRPPVKFTASAPPAQRSNEGPRSSATSPYRMAR